MENERAEGSYVSLDSLLDPHSPFLLSVILPVAVLGGLGLRKLAVIWLMGALIWRIAGTLL